MPKPIVILGCTAAGKSDLAEGLALRLGEKKHGGTGQPATVMAVDSMQVYRGMDIGTAKPPPETRAQIPYLMLDVADPWEVYSAARFVAAARPLVDQAAANGQPLVLAGGTILYLRSLIEGMFEGPGADETIRAELTARAAKEGVPALHAEMARIDPAAGQRIHPNDLRRIVRALEVHRLTGTPITQLQTQWTAGRGGGGGGGGRGGHAAVDALYIGIQRDKELLNRRINLRVKKMIDAGLVEEVRRLSQNTRGISPEAASGVGYKEIQEYLAGKGTLDDAIERIKIQTRYLAKMQRTWLKRWPGPSGARGGGGGGGPGREGGAGGAQVCWLTAAEGVEGADLVETALQMIAAAQQNP